MMLSKTRLYFHRSQETLMFHLSGKQNIYDEEKKEKKRKEKKRYLVS